jgi:hypothetical protein
VGRFVGRYLLDEVKVERYAGRGSNGNPGTTDWALVGTVRGRYRESSGWTRNPQGVEQQYSSIVLMEATATITEPEKRYRLTVTEHRGTRELEEAGTDPEVKRTRVLEVVSVSLHKDNGNNDTLQTARCINGKETR